MNPFIFYSSPYGDLSTDLNSNRYGIVVLIAGGIGVTPMQSICRQLAHDNCTCTRELQKVFLVWASRDIAMMDNMPISLDLSQHNSRHKLDLDFSNLGNSDFETPPQVKSSSNNRNTAVSFTPDILNSSIGTDLTLSTYIRKMNFRIKLEAKKSRHKFQAVLQMFWADFLSWCLVISLPALKAARSARKVKSEIIHHVHRPVS
jgi:predicted ferric reductase